jgi:hypothetical protein
VRRRSNARMRPRVFRSRLICAIRSNSAGESRLLAATHPVTVREVSNRPSILDPPELADYSQQHQHAQLDSRPGSAPRGNWENREISVAEEGSVAEPRLPTRQAGTYVMRSARSLSRPKYFEQVSRVHRRHALCPVEVSREFYAVRGGHLVQSDGHKARGRISVAGSAWMHVVNRIRNGCFWSPARRADLSGSCRDCGHLRPGNSAQLGRPESLEAGPAPICLLRTRSARCIGLRQARRSLDSRPLTFATVPSSDDGLAVVRQRRTYSAPCREFRNLFASSATKEELSSGPIRICGLLEDRPADAIGETRYGRLAVDPTSRATQRSSSSVSRTLRVKRNRRERFLQERVMRERP